MRNDNIYLNKLTNKLSSYFDITYDYKIGDTMFDFFAEYNERNSKYMFIKQAEIYAFTNHEYIFYKNFKSSCEFQLIEGLNSFLDKNIDKIVNLNNEHMSSTITFIFSCDKGFDERIIQYSRQFKYYKSFLFGLRGWAKAKLFIVNNIDNVIYANKLGKEDRNLLDILNEV